MVQWASVSFYGPSICVMVKQGRSFRKAWIIVEDAMSLAEPFHFSWPTAISIWLRQCQLKVHLVTDNYV